MGKMPLMTRRAAIIEQMIGHAAPARPTSLLLATPPAPPYFSASHKAAGAAISRSPCWRHRMPSYQFSRLFALAPGAAASAPAALLSARCLLARYYFSKTRYWPRSGFRRNTLLQLAYKPLQVCACAPFPGPGQRHAAASHESWRHLRAHAISMAER